MVNHFKNQQSKSGFALMLVILVIFGVALITGAAFSSATIIQKRMDGNFVQSQKAYYAAEAAAEDSIYRLVKAKKYQATNSLEVGSSTALIEISEIGDKKKVRLTGSQDNRFRSQELEIKVSMSEISFYYGIQVGEGGLTMNNGSEIAGSVYSNGSIQGTAATITGDAWVAGLASVIGQQSLLADSDLFFGQEGNQIDVAQSFVPVSGDKLSKVSMYLKKIGNPGDKTVRILTDNGGKPSKNLVGAGAYGTLFASQISQNAHGWIDVVFNTPPTLQAGAKYWIAIDTSAAENYFSWGMDSTNSYAAGEGKYSPNWNAGSPVWYSTGGDLAFKTWMGGLANYLAGVSVGGNAHAHRIESCDIAGDAYFTELSNSSVGGVSYPDSSDPALEAMPVSESNISDWKEAASAGGERGSYLLTNFETGSLGPKKINGDLTVSNGAILNVTGTLYVTGNISISNNAEIRLSSYYGPNSGVILADGLISVFNNVIFQTGFEDTYILLLSTKTGNAASIANNSDTVIFYASAGDIHISNNAILKEVTAYKIILDNNVGIIYESGLASAKFSSGRGGSWQIASWKEVP